MSRQLIFGSEKRRFSPRVYNPISTFAEQNKKSKFSRGFDRHADKVTYEFTPPAGGGKKPKGTTFELKYGGVKEYRYRYDGSNFCAFTMKVAETFNIILDAKYVEEYEKYEELQESQELAYRRFHTALKNAEDDKDAAEVARLKPLMEAAEQNIASHKRDKTIAVNKMHDLYILFMGDYSGTYADHITKRLDEPTTFRKTEHFLKKVAYVWDITNNTKIARAEQHDGKHDDKNFKEPDIKFRWKYFSREREVTEPAGRTLEGFLECVRLHTIHEGGYGRAEVQRKHMSNHGLFPTCLKLPAKKFAELLEEMNRNLPLLPCEKDNPEYAENDEVEWQAKPFNQYELCDIFINSMPKKVQQSFAAQNSTSELRFNLKELAIEIQPLIDQARAELKTNPPPGGGGGGGSNGNPSSNRNGKGNRNNNGGNTNGNGGNANGIKKHCARCEEYGGNPTTHRDANCRNWNADGSSKKGGKQNHSLEKQMKELNAQNKRMMKQLKELSAKRPKQDGSDEEGSFSE